MYKSLSTDDLAIQSSDIDDIHLADVVDATYTVAYLMLRLHANKCPYTPGLCREMLDTDGEETFSLIRSLQFSSKNDDRLIRFDYQGNADNEFEVFNYQLNATSGTFANMKVIINCFIHQYFQCIILFKMVQRSAFLSKIIVTHPPVILIKVSTLCRTFN